MARESKFTKEELYEAVKQLLINYGYAGFHFRLLAEKLDISRGAIYKYYKNKDELITEFMNDEMSRFLKELQAIEKFPSFNEQFDFLLSLIFKYSEIHQILRFIFQIPKSDDVHMNEKLHQLRTYHTELYELLDRFMEKGRTENIVQEHLPNSLILGFIFQTVNIPNKTTIPEKEWKQLIKNFLYYGMTK